MDLSLIFQGLFFLTPNFHTSASRNYEIDRSRLQCYAFEITETPEARQATKTDSQIWCYQQGQTAEEPLFVFEAGDKKIKPELSFIVDSEGYLTHGSLHAGILSYHKVKAHEFNPFSVPYEIPQNKKSVPIPEFSKQPAENILNDLVTHSQNLSQRDESPFLIKSGEFSAQAQSVILPWRGFWWPYKNKPLYGSENSPLAKYDAYVESHIDQVSNAQEWERSNHVYQGVWWEGHCNGWAASSILRTQPRFPRVDPVSGIVFSVADQKGILAETDYCAVTAFYGNRYRGRAGENKLDIHPHVLHKALIYYIGQLRKPVVIDYRANTAVDNHPVSGYKMEITQTSDTTFDVVSTLTFHKYDSRSTHPPAIAPSYTRVYKYTLTQNANRQIVGGTWLSANPDFLWVPLGIRDCERNNPHISHALVEEIMNLPNATEE